MYNQGYTVIDCARLTILLGASVELQFSSRKMAQLITCRTEEICRGRNDSNGSVIKTIRRFQARYGIRLPKRTDQSNYAKWRVHVTVHNFNKENSGHPKKRTEANIHTVRILINYHETKSVIKLSAETQVKTTTTVHCILKRHLHLKPYKMQRHQKLSLQDKDRRLLFTVE